MDTEKYDYGALICGLPIFIKECSISITQPSIKEICAFGEDNFFVCLQTFISIDPTIERIKEGNSQLSRLSNFQVLMIIIQEDKELNKLMTEFFKIICPNLNVNFEAGSISFYQEENSKRIVGQINPRNFDFFQDNLSLLFIPSNLQEKQIEYKPANDKAAEIAEKLKRGNKIRAEMKMREEKDKSNGSIFNNYISVLAVGLALDLNLILNYTPFQLYDSFLRFRSKQDFDFYQKISTTPFMDVSGIDAPDHWMDNIYK